MLHFQVRNDSLTRLQVIIASSSDPSVLGKPLVKRAITGGSANYNTTSPGAPTSSAPRSQLANSNHFYGANGSKNHPGGLNWPLMSQGPASIQSHLNWSNSFNSSQMANVPSINSASNTVAPNSSLQNVWSNNNNNNNVYGGPSHPKQRSPMCAQSNVPLANKKPIYGGEGQQAVLPANSALSPSKYRRNPVMGNYKNMTTAPTASLYELGSAGSDNTSSSSDSANLRENGLLYLQVSTLTFYAQLFIVFLSFRIETSKQLIAVH